MKGIITIEPSPENSPQTPESTEYDPAQHLAQLVAERGLPEGSTMEDVTAYDSAQAVAQLVAERGLPEGSTMEDVIAYDAAQRDAEKPQ